MFRSKTTRLFEAIREGGESVAEVLRRGANPDSRKAGVPALIEAAARGNAQAVLALLAAGAETDPGGIDPTALAIACQNGELEMISLLLDAGARTDAASSDGRTPLMRLLSSLGLSSVRAASASTLPEDPTPSDGVVAAVSTVHSILDSMPGRRGRAIVKVSRDALDIIERLVEQGRVDQTCARGRTALHHALELGLCERVVKLLLEAGASPDTPDLEGRTPRQLARQHPSERVREFF